MLNRPVQAVEDELDEFTHVARMFPSVLTVLCGTEPPPAKYPTPGGGAAFATPVDNVSRIAALINAFARPAFAAVVPELDTCVASVANPANAYAAATVDTSFIVMKVVEGNVFAAGQVPNAAINPAAELVPAPGFPPTAYRYTC